MVLLDYGRTPVTKIELVEDRITVHLLDGNLVLARCPELLSDYNEGKRIEFYGGSITRWKRLFHAETEYKNGYLLVNGKPKYAVKGNVAVKL